MQKNTTLSLDELYEANSYEYGTSATDPAVTVMASIMEEELLKELNSIDRKLGDMLRFRLEGMEPKEIMEQLGIKRSTFYDDMKRIVKTAEKYI